MDFKITAKYIPWAEETVDVLLCRAALCLRFGLLEAAVRAFEQAEERMNIERVVADLGGKAAQDLDQRMPYSMSAVHGKPLETWPPQPVNHPYHKGFPT